MLPGRVEELVTNGLKRLTQDARAARLGAVRQVVRRSSGEIDGSGANQVNRGLIQGIDHEHRLEWA